MVQQKEINLEAKSRGCHLISGEIIRHLPELKGDGILHIFIKHTSAGLTLNENADPSVRYDFNNFLNEMVPENHPEYTHTLEGSHDMQRYLKTL